MENAITLAAIVFFHMSLGLTYDHPGHCYKLVLISNGKCNKIGWGSFFHISLGLTSLPGSCEANVSFKTVSFEFLIFPR